MHGVQGHIVEVSVGIHVAVAGRDLVSHRIAVELHPPRVRPRRYRGPLDHKAGSLTTVAGVRFLALPLGMLTVAACAAPSSSTAEQGPALFYANSGSIYVSAPVGAPGRKLTNGPADTDPAPSPDGGRLA